MPILGVLVGGEYMKSKWMKLFATLFALSLVAAACGSAADTATDVVDEVVDEATDGGEESEEAMDCLLYTSPSPRDATLSRMPSSA